MVVVTKEFIESGETGAGGYKKAQLAILGVSWPPRQGWKNRAVGREITDEDAAAYLRLKGAVRKRSDGRNPNWWEYDALQQRWLYKDEQISPVE